MMAGKTIADIGAGNVDVEADQVEPPSDLR